MLHTSIFTPLLYIRIKFFHYENQPTQNRSAYYVHACCMYTPLSINLQRKPEFQRQPMNLRYLLEKRELNSTNAYAPSPLISSAARRVRKHSICKSKHENPIKRGVTQGPYANASSTKSERSLQLKRHP